MLRNLAILALALALAPALYAADHLDAPGATPPGGDGRLDLTDVYAFQSPASADRAVLILAVNPAAGLISPTTFNPDADYVFHIDRDGDAKSDLEYRVNFGPVANGAQDVRLRCTPAKACPSGAVLARGRTGTVLDVSGAGLLQADVFDDAFFFDLQAFLGSGGRSFCDGQESNFFLGLNVSAVVLEVPRSWVGGGTVGVWASTRLADEGQIDRMGRPAINTVFIPNNPFEPTGTEASQKNFFNAGKPVHDARDFRPEVVDTLEIFYGAGNPVAGQLADILLPDVLTVDLSSAAGFLNGRGLTDDVIDAELGIVTNGALTTDCVDNDSTFRSTFPYLGFAN